LNQNPLVLAVKLACVPKGPTSIVEYAAPWQVPATQVCVPTQAFPQAPQ
jgi:hypothetical protein